MSKDKTIAVFRDKNGHVEIHEKYEGVPKKGIRRIAHTPKLNSNDAVDKKSLSPPIIEVPILAPLKESPSLSPNLPPNVIYDVSTPSLTSAPKTTASPKHGDLRKRLLATKPIAISEPDFLQFMKIVDELVSDDDEEDDDDVLYGENRSDLNGEIADENVVEEPPQSAIDENNADFGSAVEVSEPPLEAPTPHGDAGGPKANRHVRFSEHNDFRIINDDAVASLPASPSATQAINVDTSAAEPMSPPSVAAISADSSPKPILRNKSEISPINEPWIRKIQKKEELKKREFIPQTLFSDEVVERNLDDVSSNPSATPLTTASADPSSSTSGAAKAPQTGQRNVSKFKKMRQAKQLNK